MTRSFASTCRLRTSLSSTPGADERTAKANFAHVSQLRSLHVQKSPIISSTLTSSRRYEKWIPAPSMVASQFSFEHTWPRSFYKSPTPVPQDGPGMRLGINFHFQLDKLARHNSATLYTQLTNASPAIAPYQKRRNAPKPSQKAGRSAPTPSITRRR